MNPRQKLHQQIIKSLVHPIVIGSIFALLLNDHWLRWQYPSWWTGKIGGFVWLIFAPFLLIFLLSFVWPKTKLALVGPVGFFGTGLVFTLGNTIPSFHELIAWLFQQIAGWKPLMILDPTDLLLFPGLIIGWKIWQDNQKQPQPKVSTRKKHMLGWILLSLSAVGTMANQPSFPDYGVYCVVAHEQSILAITSAEAGWFESGDGGQTWTQFRGNTQGLEKSCLIRSAVPWQISDPEHPNRLWRIQESKKFIEQSIDNGRNWHTVYEFPAGEQVRNYHYRPEAEFLVSDVVPGGPFNGVVDPATGSLIVSMGLEGVVVVSPTEEANRVAVGPYAFVEINELSLGQRLNKELILALILGLLAVCIGSLPTWKHSRTRTFYLVMVVGATAVWLIYALLSREVGIVSFIGLAPAADSIQDIPPLAFCGWFYYLCLLGAAIVQIRKCGSWQLVRQLLETAVVSIILFLIPLIFWATGILPSYQLAIVIGVAMAIFPIQNTYRNLDAFGAL